MFNLTMSEWGNGGIHLFQNGSKDRHWNIDQKYWELIGVNRGKIGFDEWSGKGRHC